MGKAKFDLANFDIKLIENLLCTLKKYLFLQKCLANLFFYFIHNVKKWHFDVHFIEIMSKVWLRRYPTSPPFRKVLLLFQTTRRWGKSQRALVHSLVHHRSGFQSVSGPGPYRVQGGGEFSIGFALKFFLSGLMVLHCSGQIPKTVALYYTTSKFWER